VALILFCVTLALSEDELLTDAALTAEDLAFREQLEYLLSHSPTSDSALENASQTVCGNATKQAERFAGDLPAADSSQWRRAVDGSRWRGAVLLRVQTDSLAGRTQTAAVFARAGLERGPWQVAWMFEKDRGESSLFDFVGGGLRYCSGRVNAVLGDYDFGVGQGLVFSSSYGRSAVRLAENVGPAASLDLSRHANESSPLRGTGVEIDMGRWRLAGLFSSTRRDAKLNPDGTVERLETGGVHDDSASRARRIPLEVLLGGASVRYRIGGKEAGLHAGVVGYSRDFAPADSSNSFTGRGLVSVASTFSWYAEPWQADAEAAVCGTGFAGAARLVGRWKPVGTRVTLRWRSRRYFAPYGRWTSLAGRQERLEATGMMEWKRAGLRVGASGNTYRDFERDSLPARVELLAGQRMGSFGCDLRLGRSYALTAERRRTARFDVMMEQAGQERGLRITFSDEHPETRPGRGRMMAGVGSVRLGNWQLDAALGRFDITASGMRMYMSEPGAMRIGSAYSTTRSAWRGAVGLAVRLQRTARLGLKVGWEHAGKAAWDAAAQVDMVLGR